MPSNHPYRWLSTRDCVPLYLYMLNHQENYEQVKESSLQVTSAHETSMGEVIQIREHNGQRAVSARELHQVLDSRQDFSTWMKNRIEKYGFIENQDFEVFHKFMENPEGGRPLKEYALSIDMAKEIAMVEGNERGRMVRQYFIKCEKELREASLASYQIEDPIVRAEKWIEEQRQRKELEARNRELEATNYAKDELIEVQAKEIKVQAPKAEYYDKTLQSTSTYTTTQIAKEIGTYAEKLNKKLKELGILMKQSGQWMLREPYSQSKLHSTRTYLIDNGNGNTKTNVTTVWTEKGRRFIHLLHEKDYNVRATVNQMQEEKRMAMAEY